MGTTAFMTNVRVRVLVIVAVLVLSVWAIYPPKEKIKLGLDLNGGVHLVLRVRTDHALAPADESTREETVQQALEIIDRRVNEMGVAESVVARYIGNDQILVQLPGVTDVDRAKQIIKSTAQLHLTLVEQGPFPSEEEARLAYNHSIPAHLDVLPGRSDVAGQAGPLYYIVRKVPAISGKELRDARQSLDEFNRPAVAFTLEPDAARRFGTFTGQNINRPLATVLDKRVMSVATIQGRIDDRGQIAGVSREEMIEQVINLKRYSSHRRLR